jgi:hypothetical protein
VALNYVYGVVKADGLTTVMPNSNVYLEQLSGHKEVRFDLRKFPIIGSQEKNYMLLYMRGVWALYDGHSGNAAGPSKNAPASLCKIDEGSRAGC